VLKKETRGMLMVMTVISNLLHFCCVKIKCILLILFAYHTCCIGVLKHICTKLGKAHDIVGHVDVILDQTTLF